MCVCSNARVQQCAKHWLASRFRLHSELSTFDGMIDETYEELKDNLMNFGAKHFGRKHSTPKQEWLSDDTMEMSDRRQMAIAIARRAGEAGPSVTLGPQRPVGLSRGS